MKKHLQKVIDASEGAEIIVSDDCSSDGSVDYLTESFPGVTVVENKKRQGFAGNVNAGVAHARGDIVVLLNTDVEPEKRFLPPILSHFKDGNVFAVGCLEKSHENGKVILRGRGIARWEKGYYIHSRGEVNRTDTAWVSGGSGAFRKSMWDTLGGMDTIYNPFYWEDIDLSYRGRKAGWKILFEPKSVVHHYHEEGKIKSEFSQDDVKRIVYRNQFIFIWKNLTDKTQYLLHLVYTPLQLIQAFLRKDNGMFTGYWLALQQLIILMRRKKEQYLLNVKLDKELDILK